MGVASFGTKSTRARHRVSCSCRRVYASVPCVTFAESYAHAVRFTLVNSHEVSLNDLAEQVRSDALTLQPQSHPETDHRNGSMG